MKILDFGCGNKKVSRAGAEVVGMDHDRGSAADVFHDANVFPYPFSDNTFDEVVCSDVLEHVIDVPRVVKELHRIAKPGALFKIHSPHFSSVYAFLDPTHLHPFSILSFDCFCKNRKIIPHNITQDLFMIRTRKIIFPKLTRIFCWPGVKLANRFPFRYEQYLAYHMQAENIYLELEVLK
jgi:SAM-dependent methyltransferase